MDSSLILQYVEAEAGRSLWSADALERRHEFRAVSLALAACEKSVQIVYERKRPVEARYGPWVERVTGQMLAAFAALEQEVQRRPAVFAASDRQAAISTAITWQFTQSMLGAEVPADDYPGLAALSARLEQSAPFLKYQPE